MDDRSGMTPLGQRFDLADEHLPTYKSLREAGPLVPNKGAIPIPCDWLATDWDTVNYVFRHTEQFSSARMAQSSMGNTRPLIPLEVDPPEHVRYRRLLDPFFSPNRLRPLEPALRQQINELIDAFVDQGEVDLLEALFVPYPTQVFLTMYGLPLEERPRFLRWKDMMIREGLSDPTAGPRAFAELEVYMTAYLDARSAGGGGGSDLLSQFLLPDEHGDRLSTEDVLDITALFIMAGLDTVTTALTHSFAYLARHPEERRRLVEDPALIPGAVEELIRTTTPAPALVRVATEDVELGGVTVRAGQGVFCHLGAANGDPTQQADAERVDLYREKNRHASFGLGVHRCVGSHLARMEVRLVIDEFHRRIPGYELAPDADLVRVPFYEGVDRLPIVFTPGGGTASVDETAQ